MNTAAHAFRWLCLFIVGIPWLGCNRHETSTPGDTGEHHQLVGPRGGVMMEMDECVRAEVIITPLRGVEIHFFSVGNPSELRIHAPTVHAFVASPDKDSMPTEVVLTRRASDEEDDIYFTGQLSENMPAGRLA
ncbi:MAG: hypothetical protein U1D30_20215, partial [Planctomycetota bacterium]